MPQGTARRDSLVLYKNRPARVASTGPKKLEINVEGGQTLSVRHKDVVLLHPGPIESLAELQSLTGELETAWELLEGETTTLSELAELAYGAFTPASAWTVWQAVSDGLYFSGSPVEIIVHDAETVVGERAARAAKAAEEEAWQSFLSHAAQGYYEEEDKRYLQEVAALAWGHQDSSRVLQAMGHAESVENAHAVLLRLGYWDYQVNPYPRREGLTIVSPELDLNQLPEEPRRDLTHLLALAIDDEDSKDPDDALSTEEGHLWVHIADVAAIVPPDSPADIEARMRAVNLYLPEGTVTMLPNQATRNLALGLAEVSPALSFGFDVSSDGAITGTEVIPSWVRVTRITYEEAEARKEEPPLAQFYHLAQVYEDRRRQNGSIHIDLPEVKIRVHNGEVDIRPLERLRSRDMVREAMLMTGEAVARFTLENDIPVPFTVQDDPAGNEQPAVTPSEMFARRRTLKASQRSGTPGSHAGLGMGLYVQSTSPLRRYLDLVVHQQLRAFLRGGDLLDAQALMARVGAADAVSGSARWAERRSNEHWTLVYLLQHPEWRGTGIIVDKRGAHDIVLIPELGLETRVYRHHELSLDSEVTLQLQDVNLPNLETHFTLVV
jgi:exoribonuclease-2